MPTIAFSPALRVWVVRIGHRAYYTPSASNAVRVYRRAQQEAQP